MKRLGILFVLAVLGPSVVLAWLAIRSLRDQQFVLERQQSLLYQGTADALAESMRATMAGLQHDFEGKVEAMLADKDGRTVAADFDRSLRAGWPMAAVGFAVSIDGEVLSPPLFGDTEARRFRHEQELFLSNRETAEVYPTLNTFYADSNKERQQPQVESKLGYAQDNLRQEAFKGKALQENAPATPVAQATAPAEKRRFAGNMEIEGASAAAAPAPDKDAASPEPRKKEDAAKSDEVAGLSLNRSLATQKAEVSAPAPSSADRRDAAKENEQLKSKSSFLGFNGRNVRNVVPQQQQLDLSNQEAPASRLNVEAAEFRKVVSDAGGGLVSRFVDNRLRLLLWHRPAREGQLIFGAELKWNSVIAALREKLVLDYGLGDDICAVLLDDSGKPVAQTAAGFVTNWKRPFVATEVGEVLPHWEIGIYLKNPDQLNQAARSIRLTVGLLIAVLVCAIAAGGWLIMMDVQRQVLAARQKADFVSNVSHELKTPLTSIRMFSDLLAEGRTVDSEKGREYAGIISAEAARLTRLINNVLDFSKGDRDGLRYAKTALDLRQVAEEVATNYRPHLESGGYRFELVSDGEDLPVHADRDVVAQVILNLISNAEKYGGVAKEIMVETRKGNGVAEILVLDRGPGVAAGNREKIFEEFYREHDSLSSGIQGSGLGLTLARRMARAHGGDIRYVARDGGGSCFVLCLPLTGERAQS